jgi:hypothetical protein
MCNVLVPVLYYTVVTELWGPEEQKKEDEGEGHVEQQEHLYGLDVGGDGEGAGHARVQGVRHYKRV